MQRRPLGSTGMSLSAVGLGTWNGGPVREGVSDERVRDAIRTPRSAGVIVIDTAEMYGDGRALGVRVVDSVRDGV
jgi:aryl-alcohol dehydrogenase-like predicted oxidoreductase